MTFKTNRMRLLISLMIILISGQSFAATINTGNVAGTTTAGIPLISNCNATPISVIRFEVGGAKFTSSGGELTISMTVDATTPAVTAGTAPDQSFRDDSAGAAYFGYYLSSGVRSSGQSAANVNIKVAKGSGETLNRSYYLLGNGTTVPTTEGNLTIAPASATTVVSTTPNTIRCGTNYSANGLTGSELNCAAGTTVANMDITQFVKILFTDAPSVVRVSQLELTAVAE